VNVLRLSSSPVLVDLKRDGTAVSAAREIFFCLGKISEAASCAFTALGLDRRKSIPN